MNKSSLEHIQLRVLTYVGVLGKEFLLNQLSNYEGQTLNVCTEKGKRAHYRLIVWQCFIIFSQGATGIVQAMTLSFGGLQFSAGHFEFAANPASLHTTITFRRIHLYEDMDIFLSVTVNEDNGHAEKLIVKPVKGGKTPLYACEAGCQYDPMEVGY